MTADSRPVGVARRGDFGGWYPVAYDGSRPGRPMRMHRAVQWVARQYLARVR